MEPDELRKAIDALNRLGDIFTKNSDHVLLAYRNYLCAYVAKEQRGDLLRSNDFQKLLDILDPDAPCKAKSLSNALVTFCDAVYLIVH